MQRDFSAARRNELWVADFTYLRCWEGLVFFAFVVDAYSREVVGWQFAAHMRTDLVLDALNTRRQESGEGGRALTPFRAHPATAGWQSRGSETRQWVLLDSATVFAKSRHVRGETLSSVWQVLIGNGGIKPRHPPNERSEIGSVMPKGSH